MERGQIGGSLPVWEGFAVRLSRTVSDEVKAQGLSYCAGLWKAEEVGEALWAEARKRGKDTVYEDVEVGIGDGAAWIWNLMQTHYPYATQIVDWYHAEERLWIVGQAVYGQGTEKAKEWVEGRLRPEGSARRVDPVVGWEPVGCSPPDQGLEAASFRIQGGSSSSFGVFHQPGTPDAISLLPGEGLSLGKWSGGECLQESGRGSAEARGNALER